MMDVQQTNCDNHIMMYVSQFIMVYLLNLYSAICQIFLNNTGRKKKRPSLPTMELSVFASL